MSRGAGLAKALGRNRTSKLLSSEKAALLRRAHMALSATGELPITTNRKYEMLLDAVFVPGNLELTYDRYVAALISYRKLLDEIEERTIERIENPSSVRKRRKKRTRKGSKRRRGGSQAGGKSIKTVRGGLPGLGRRR